MLAVLLYVILASGAVAAAAANALRDVELSSTVVTPDIRPEDTGNYSCQVRSRQSTVLLRQNFSLVVIDRITSVHIDSSSANSSKSELHLIAGQPTTVRCVVTSGLPHPTVDIFVDGLNVSGLFDISRRYRLRPMSSLHRELYSQLQQPNHSESTSYSYPLKQMTLAADLEQSHMTLPPMGLRSVIVMTTRSTKLFTAGARDDGSKLSCRAKQEISDDVQLADSERDVPSMVEVISAEMTLAVNYGPLVTCGHSKARVGQTGVCLVCQLGARPPITSIHWIDGRPNDSSRWTVTRIVRPDHLETSLCLLRVKKSDFRTYTVITENQLQRTQHNVTLQRIYDFGGQLQGPQADNDEIMSRSRSSSSNEVHFDVHDHAQNQHQQQHRRNEGRQQMTTSSSLGSHSGLAPLLGSSDGRHNVIADQLQSVAEVIHRGWHSSNANISSTAAGTASSVTWFLVVMVTRAVAS